MYTDLDGWPARQPATGVHGDAGRHVPTAQHVNPLPFPFPALQEGYPACPAGRCLPCYCLGLAESFAAFKKKNITAPFLEHITDTCSNYRKAFDLQ
jgi:hypothetical protein